MVGRFCALLCWIMQIRADSCRFVQIRANSCRFVQICAFLEKYLIMIIKTTDTTFPSLFFNSDLIPLYSCAVGLLVLLGFTSQFFGLLNWVIRFDFCLGSPEPGVRFQPSLRSSLRDPHFPFPKASSVLGLSLPDLSFCGLFQSLGSSLFPFLLRQLRSSSFLPFLLNGSSGNREGNVYSRLLEQLGYLRSL